MISQHEENTLKGVVGKLAKQVEEMNEKLDGVVNAQGKVNTSLQEMATARRTGTPLNLMNAETVEKTISEKLNSQLVKSKVSVDVRNATIGDESKVKIDGLMRSTGNLTIATNKLIESNKAIKPRRPLLNLTIQNGKKVMWLGVSLSVLFLVGLIWSIVWANKKVNSIQDQAFYWANRAYQAALMRDIRHPGYEYEETYNLFIEDVDKAKEHVQGIEWEAKRYKEWKQDLLSVICEKDSRDIRVLNWEYRDGEAWILYRFFDEEINRSVHIWPDKKVEETTDKIVTDLASAQKYSKRKIWTVIREAPNKSDGE